MSAHAVWAARTEELVAALSDACLVVAKASIGGMALLVTVDVIARWLVRWPVPGSYEVVGILGAFAVAGALPHVQRSGAFIYIETLTEGLPRKGQTWIRGMTLAVETILFAILAVQFLSTAITLSRTGQVTDILALPVWLIYALVSIGF